MHGRGPRRLVLRTATAWLAALLALPLAGAAGATTIRFASVGGITDGPVYIARDLGFFDEAGLKVQLQRMANAPALITATATGQVDVAGISVTPGLFSSMQQGLELRVVGDKQSLGKGFSATRLVIRSDLAKPSEEENMQTLRGKKIAVSAKASSVYMLLRDLLKKHGMALTDVTVVELAYPNILPALTSKAIDGAINLEPFLSQALQSGAAKLVSDLTEFVPTHGASIVPLVYSERFAKNAEVGKAFMKAYMRGVRVYNDAFLKNKDKEKVIDIMARGANIDPVVIRDGLPAGFEPNQRVSTEFLDRLQVFFSEQQFLRSKVDVSKLVDPSFAEAAVAELGIYQ